LRKILDQVLLPKKIDKPVRRSLDLQRGCSLDRAASTDDTVARTHQQRRVAIDRARPILEFTREAVVNAVKTGFLGVPEIQVAEHSPYAQRDVADQWLLHLTEPTHEAREEPTRDAIGQQKIKVLPQ